MQQAHEIVSGTGARPKPPKRDDESHKDEQESDPSRGKGCWAVGDDEDWVRIPYEGDCKYLLLPDCSSGKEKSFDEQRSTSKTSNRTIEMTNQTMLQESKSHLTSCADFMEILTKFHDLAIPSWILKNLLKLLCHYGQSIPYVGVILGKVEGMLPDEKHKQIIGLLQDLSKEIKAVRADIMELENRIKLELVNLQYSDIVTKIQTGMDYLSKILTSTDVEKTNFEERLRELCSNQAMHLAVTNLRKGLTGEDFFHNDILKTIYGTREYRGRSQLMCIRFLQLFSGGLAVIAAYEALVRGAKAAMEMKTFFEGDIEKLKRRFEDFQQKYKDRFRENMLEDLNEVLDGNMSNKEGAAQLKDLLRDKYDWLKTYCIICKESIFIDYCFSGDRVQSLERNGKFGVIFYREILEDRSSGMPIESNLRRADGSLYHVRQMIIETDRDCWFSDADRINFVLKDKLRSIGFCLLSCATVKAKRIISIPFLTLPGLIGSTIALNGFETSIETAESSEAVTVVCDLGRRKYVCLISRPICPRKLSV